MIRRLTAVAAVLASGLLFASGSAEAHPFGSWHSSYYPAHTYYYPRVYRTYYPVATYYPSTAYYAPARTFHHHPVRYQVIRRITTYRTVYHAPHCW